MPVAVAVDLEIEVDGIEGRVVDDGAALVVSSPHPIRFALAAARGRPDRSLAHAGLPITALLSRPIVLRGPRAQVLRLQPRAGRDGQIRSPRVVPGPAVAACLLGGMVLAAGAALRPRR